MSSNSAESSPNFLEVEGKRLEEFQSTAKEPRQVTTVKVTSDNIPNDLSLCQEELRRTKEENTRLVEENKRLKAAINCLTG